MITAGTIRHGSFGTRNAATEFTAIAAQSGEAYGSSDRLPRAFRQRRWSVRAADVSFFNGG